MPKRRPRVLLVEGDAASGRTLAAALEAAGFDVTWARDRRAADAALERPQPDALVVALDDPESGALDVLRRARAADPDRPAVAILAQGDAESALAALRAGAGPAHERPVDAESLAESVRRALPARALLRRLDELEAQAAARTGVIARSRAMARVLEQVERVAGARVPLLIEGEPGTGKRRVARLVHALSPRRTARFVAVDCAVAGEPALEAVLFGSPAGALTGSVALELAEGGTLYLERASAAPPSVQVRLLRLLQERKWERPGGVAAAADVRLVVSNERDLSAEVAAGGFRADLAERLGVARLAIPPLRERREDLPHLVREILLRLPRGSGRKARAITRGALERLAAHDWPGNLDELKRTIETMAAGAERGAALGLADLPAPLRAGLEGAGAPLAPGMTAAEAERALIAATLRHTGGDRARAAALLGIGLRTLYRKLRSPAG